MKDLKAPADSGNPFLDFFQYPVYLEFKSHLYNYRLRRKKVQKILKRVNPSGLVLEIGSGVSTLTDRPRNTVFSDISLHAMKYLREKKNAPYAAVMDITSIALKNACVETVICSEVLEHIKNDNAAMSEILRVLKPGGSFIMTVPTHPKYYAFDDQYVGHERRYAIWPLIRKLKKIGFDGVEMFKITGFLDKITMVFLAHAYAAFFKKPKKAPQDSPLLKILLPVYKALNKIYSRLIGWEAQALPLSTAAVVMIYCRKGK